MIPFDPNYRAPSLRENFEFAIPRKFENLPTPTDATDAYLGWIGNCVRTYGSSFAKFDLYRAIRGADINENY